MLYKFFCQINISYILIKIAKILNFFKFLGEIKNMETKYNIGDLRQRQWRNQFSKKIQSMKERIQHGKKERRRKTKHSPPCH